MANSGKVDSKKVHDLVEKVKNAPPEKYGAYRYAMVLKLKKIKRRKGWCLVEIKSLNPAIGDESCRQNSLLTEFAELQALYNLIGATFDYLDKRDSQS